MIKYKPKDIECPLCKGIVIRYKGQEIPPQAKCKECKILVTYYPQIDRIKTSRVPGMNPSGGRLY